MFRGFRGERVTNKGLEKVKGGPNIAEPSESVEVQLNYEPIRRINRDVTQQSQDEIDRETLDAFIKDLKRGL